MAKKYNIIPKFRGKTIDKLNEKFSTEKNYRNTEIHINCKKLFIFCFFLTFSKELQLYAYSNDTFANGKGGAYLNWEDNEKDVHYKIFLKTKNDQWEPLSTHKIGTSMKVLNIYPSENKLGANVQLDEAVKINNVTMKFNKDQMEHIYPKSASLKVWMEGGFIESINSDPLGIDPELKEQIIDVTLNSIDEFETSEENFIYQFDVVVFGFWDYSGGFSLSTEKSKGIVEKYIKNGYGFIAGHDSIILEFLDDDNDDKPIGLTAIRDLFGIGIHQKEGSYEGAKSSEVEVHKQGLILNYPWDLNTSQKQQIYWSHTAKQNAAGDIWYSFSDSTTQISETENFYLTTYGNTAMIQTGHSECNATEFERKVLANTIFYLKQRTTEHEYEEHHYSIDKANPEIINITIDPINYLAIIEAYDVGTLYTFKVASYNSEGKEIDNSEADVNVTTGIKCYKYLINENSKCDVETMVNTAYNDTIKFTTEDIVYQRYLHVAPVDKADNIGKAISIRLNFSTNTFSQSNTLTRSNSFTRSNTFTNSNTLTRSNTPTNSNTFTRSNTFTNSFPFGLILTNSIIFYSTYSITETIIQKAFYLSTFSFYVIDSKATYIYTNIIYYNYTVIYYSTIYNFYSNFFTLINPIKELNNENKNTNMIIVIVVCVLILIVIVIIIYLIRRNKNNKTISSGDECESENKESKQYEEGNSANNFQSVFNTNYVEDDPFAKDFKEETFIKV